MRNYLLAAFIGLGLLAGVSLLKATRPLSPTISRSIAALVPPALPADRQQAERELHRVVRQLRALRPAQPYIVVDTHANVLYLRTMGSIIMKTPCSTGSGGDLYDKATGRTWSFQTPRGAFRVESNLVDPWWRKPDWAYIEEDLPVPSDPRQRLDPEMLGDYALGFGDDYYIHGTIYERLLGVSVTHGCVRVGSEDLKRLYDRVTIGTRIYVF